jgi:hypothetical protein
MEMGVQGLFSATVMTFWQVNEAIMKKEPPNQMNCKVKTPFFMPIFTSSIILNRAGSNDVHSEIKDHWSSDSKQSFPMPSKRSYSQELQSTPDPSAEMPIESSG